MLISDQNAMYVLYITMYYELFLLSFWSLISHCEHWSYVLIK